MTTARLGPTPMNSPMAPASFHADADRHRRAEMLGRLAHVSGNSPEANAVPLNPVSTLLPRCDGCDACFSSSGGTPHLLACGHTLCPRCLRRSTDRDSATVRCPLPPRGCAASTAMSATRVNYAIDDVVCPFVPSSLTQPTADDQHLVLDLAVDMHIMCTICLEAYREEHMPLALPCGHTFCHRCLARLRAGDLFKCPNRCPLPEEDPRDPELLSLLPVPNFALLRVVNALRAMHTVPPIDPGLDCHRLLMKAADEEGSVREEFPSSHLPAGYSVPLGPHRTEPPRCMMVGMLLYTVFAASSAAVVALTQGPDCSKLRRWLAGLAALFVAVPTATVLLKRYPSRPCKVIRLGTGLIFYCWVVCGIPWGWASDGVCPLLSITWLLGTMLLCIHLAFGLLQLSRELLRFLGHCQAGAQCLWISQLAPFMDVF